MNCPGCGGPMRMDDEKACLHCLYCAKIVFPEPNEDGVKVLGEPDDALCPVCRVPMVIAAVLDVRILHCERCRGVVIPMPVFGGLVGELRARRKGPPAPLAPSGLADLEREVVCPGCHQRMETYPYCGPGNFIIDNCSRCGLNWLDHGELRRITMAPDQFSSANQWTISE